jgi:hypothetical protein
MSQSKKRKKGEAAATSSTDPANDDAPLQWEDVKKARNRINSQRTREREKIQLESLEVEKTRLAISNDALIYQNRHFRESIRQIYDVTKLHRTRARITEENRNGKEVNYPQDPLSSHPNMSVDRAVGAVGARGSAAAVIDQETYALPMTDPLRYSGIERGFRRFPSSIHVPGSSSLDDLRVRHQAVLEAEAALLRRQRVAEIGNLQAAGPQLTQSSSLMVNFPTAMLPPLDIMEIRARQLRIQELELAAGRGVSSANMIIRYPHGIPASTMTSHDSLRDIHEEGKRGSRHAKDRKAHTRN